jgi:hypothetical protein
VTFSTVYLLVRCLLRCLVALARGEVQGSGVFRNCDRASRSAATFGSSPGPRLAIPPPEMLSRKADYARHIQGSCGGAPIYARYQQNKQHNQISTGEDSPLAQPGARHNRLNIHGIICFTAVPLPG